MSRFETELEAYDQGAIDVIDSITETIETQGDEFRISGPNLIKLLNLVREDINNKKGTL